MPTFTNLTIGITQLFACYHLGEEGDHAVEMALKHPENYVMKSQRECRGTYVCTHVW